MMKNTPRSRRWATGFALVGAAFVPMLSQATEPAQIPLTSRVSEPPPPNVMLTIDDSGSMLADFMPEGNFKVKYKDGGTDLEAVLTFGSYWVGAYPADWRKLCTSGLRGCRSGTWPIGNYLRGVVTGLKTSPPIYQIQYRSPDVNAIYYNPDLRYLPWYKPDGSERMANSTPSAARLDPVVSNGTFDLTHNYKDSKGTYAKITTTWFTGPATSESTQKEFYPGLYYRLTTGADPTKAASYVAYDINATDGKYAPDVPHDNRTECTERDADGNIVGKVKCTQEQERQNFANWFTYYRMRESLTKAAVSETLVAFKDKLRLGWARINKEDEDNIDGESFTRIEVESNGGPMRPLNADRLTTVLTGVQGIKSWPSTPLRTALNEIGRYFDLSLRSETGNPWLTDPASGNSGKLECRRSVDLMMTDGYYNDSYTGTGNQDNTDGTDYAGLENNPYGYSPTKYTAQRPFSDGYSNTLADIAMRYYKNDLESSMKNKVAPITGDIAYWQHLTQFMVGLGVKGTLNSSTPKDKAETLAKITAGDLAWPNPCGSCTAQKIDDMWHAAVNTGGDFYSVSNVTELTTALQNAFGKAAGYEAKEAGVATASATIVAENVKYVPKYKSVSWYGDLEAWALNDRGETEGATAKWKASEHVPAHADRNLFTWFVDGDKHYGVEFKWGAMGASNEAKVGSQNLTNYIRGETKYESGDEKQFRSRAGQPLGDFVNSPPVVVQGLVDLGYSAIESSYVDYVAAKKARSDSAIFLGGNDGMLHAFRGSTGEEVYGYLPREGLTHLATIAAPDYGTAANFHRFFVDGPVSETDAFITLPGGSSPEWSNLVIGSMGAGGKAFFALHVPTASPTSLGSKTVLWENSGEADGDVGYMFADFAVGKLKGGGWKAFVGNGAYSTNGNAVLLIVDVASGTIEKKITVEKSGSNGLMGVSLVKDDTTKEVVAAYAGDLQGNVWRFDFAGGAPDDWNVSFKGRPLFQATGPTGQPQPITVPPMFVNHSKGGRVVLFGTGRLIDSADADSTDVQSYYGVWDKTRVGESALDATSSFDGVDVDRSALQVHTVSMTPKETTTGIFYEIATSPVDWENQLGWMFDLPFSHQRVVYPSVILGNQYVLLSSIVPAPVAEECESTNGLGYNYILSAQDGTQIDEPIFDTDGDGDVDGDDQIAAGFQSSSDGRDALVSEPGKPLIGGDGGEGLICNTENNCKRVELPDPKDDCDPDAGEICENEVKDRIWKQIVTPPKPTK